jgi:cytochrome P450
MTHAHNILFPSLINHHFLPYDRDTYLSAKALRALFQKMVDKRRALQKSDPQKVKEQGDLLSILITDELFANDNEMIVDECMTFFFAGS